MAVPPWSTSGATFTWPEAEPHQATAHTRDKLWLDDFPRLIAVPGTEPMQTWKQVYSSDNEYAWPLGHGVELIEFMMKDMNPNNSAGQIKFFEVGMEILNSRPFTLVHGDLNSGNAKGC